MPEEEIITGDTLPSNEDGESAAQSNGAVTLTELLNKELGKNFTSDEAALKAVKDTFSYVGKKTEDIAKEVQAKDPQANPSEVRELAKRIEELEFYKANPDFEKAKDVINALDKGEGASAVVKTEQFKEIWKKVSGYDEVTQSKSVLQSNPKLGQIKDKLTEAREASTSGNDSKARESATQAVIDAYEL